MLHEERFDELASHAKKKGEAVICPICRKKVNNDKIVKKQLLEAEANVEVYDPFKVVDEENQAELDVELTAKKVEIELKEVK